MRLYHLLNRNLTRLSDVLIFLIEDQFPFKISFIDPKNVFIILCSMNNYWYFLSRWIVWIANKRFSRAYEPEYWHYNSWDILWETIRKFEELKTGHTFINFIPRFFGGFVNDGSVDVSELEEWICKKKFQPELKTSVEKKWRKNRDFEIYIMCEKWYVEKWVWRRQNVFAIRSSSTLTTLFWKPVHKTFVLLLFFPVHRQSMYLVFGSTIYSNKCPSTDHVHLRNDSLCTVFALYKPIFPSCLVHGNDTSC